MGLPLFVAPVESNLPHKKNNGVLSSSRSTIRRLTHPNRDRRNATRRAAVRMFGITQPTLPPRQFPSPDRALDPERPTAEEHASRPLREPLRDMPRTGTSRRERLDGQMSSIFGGTWQDMGPVPSRREEEHREMDIGWWSVDGQPRAMRARVVSPETSRNGRSSPNMRHSYNGGIPPLHPISDLLERIEQNQRSSSTVLNETVRRHQSRLLRNLSSGHQASSRRALGVDGLGDRDRSLSPEVWDTLLSTLTPDPQPPSAGSSFASVAALQSVGPPPAAPDVADQTAMDPACESGCENSDTEGPDYEHPDFEPIRLRRGELRRYREEPRRRRAELHPTLRVPEYNLDGPSEGPFARRVESPGPLGPARQNRDPDGFLPLFDWASAGPSDDERGAGRPRQNRENSAGAGPGPGPGLGPGAHMGEEWLGMRRIVRSLAAREDIPDEWWAEAGLSRTLPQDDSN